MRVIADLRRLDVPDRPMRFLGDGIHGNIHLPRFSERRSRGDALLGAEEPLRLSAGSLPGGSRLHFEVRVKRTE